MQFRAMHRYARITPRKARLVADLIRREPVDDALEMLRRTPKRAASFVAKVLKSAIANAERVISEGGIDLEAADLVVAEICVDEGPTIKRWRPRSRGMANKVERKTCHIRVALAPAPGKGEAGAEQDTAETVEGAAPATPAPAR